MDVVRPVRVLYCVGDDAYLPTRPRMEKRGKKVPEVTPRGACAFHFISHPNIHSLSPTHYRAVEGEPRAVRVPGDIICSEFDTYSVRHSLPKWAPPFTASMRLKHFGKESPQRGQRTGRTRSRSQTRQSSRAGVPGSWLGARVASHSTSQLVFGPVT